MSRARAVWAQVDSNEVLSLMLKAYILSLVLVVSVVAWTASDAWVQYSEYCYMTGTIFTSNFTNF